MSTVDLEHLLGWVGRQERTHDIITPGLVQRFNATLAGPMDIKVGLVPLCLHWCFAPPAVEEAETGPDGHPARGGFLPPVPLERRMWAGGNVEFLNNFEIGEAVTKRSTIASVDHKKGRSGELVFVGVDHEYSTPRGVAVRERQNIVYRDAPKPAADAKEQEGKEPEKKPKPEEAGQHQRTMRSSTLLMFRYSALTFNGHRIHYDKDYATEQEGYPDLVFHGPLQATLLANFATEVMGKPVAMFEYKGVSPLFANDLFTLNANETQSGLELWTADGKGQKCMVATAS